ncbi:MAG: cation transporter [Thermodesulfovibrio sp.]|nr:cation transporter [Thermodesulfovibrio sp.]
MDRTSEIRKVLLITLLLNIFVSGVKLLYGYLTNSVAITSDGFHSMFDGISNVVGLIGIYIAAHPPDKCHPYGHRKYETVFTIFIGILMFITCIEIFKEVYASFAGRRETIVTDKSFFIMLFTMAVNIFVTTYEKKMGLKLNSEYLIADSQHTKSDIYVSISVIASLVLIKLGFPLADPVMGLIVGIFVARMGINIIKEATETLVDRTQGDILTIQKIACSVDGVIECHEIRTRGSRGNIFVDLHILVNPSLPLEDAHKIADMVEEKIKSKLPDIVDVIVHLEPSS